jgi:Ca-activated chloride channel family protein
MDLATGQILPHRMAAGNVTLEDISQNRAPMQLALVMDCSGSMYGASIAAAKQAASAFVEKTLAQPNRQVAVVAFPGGVATPPTSDIERLKRAINDLTPIGSTPMGDGLHDARDLLRPRAGVQRVFVVMTDGHPDDPDDCVAEVHKLRTSGARIITIGVGREVSQDFLRSLASQPSDFHFCGQFVELEGTFINLATTLAAD